jgi:hypothetical protein
MADATHVANVTFRPIRFVLLGESLVSDWGNPAATTIRAVMRELDALGHQAMFLEPRGNAPTLGLLRARGGSPLSAFSNQFPELQYRTVEMPAGLEGVIWLAREFGVADAAVVMDTAPDAVFAAIPSPKPAHLVRIAYLTRPDGPRFPAEITLDATDLERGVPFGPAVSRHSTPSAETRGGVLLVAYDNQELATRASRGLSGVPGRRVSAGSVEGAGWDFVPEVDLPELYRLTSIAVLADPFDQPMSLARALLPLAAGCLVVTLADRDSIPAILGIVSTTVEQLASIVESAEATAAGIHPSDLPPSFDARNHATRLCAAVDAVLARQDRTPPTNAHDRQ